MHIIPEKPAEPLRSLKSLPYGTVFRFNGGTSLYMRIRPTERICLVPAEVYIVHLGTGVFDVPTAPDVETAVLVQGAFVVGHEAPST